MSIFERLPIFSMADEISDVKRQLHTEGTSTDGFIFHVAKIILWYGKEESWYQTLSKDITPFALTRLKPKNKRIPEKIVKEKLFDPRCQTKENFEDLLENVSILFEDDLGKPRKLDINKTWDAFVNFQKQITDLICLLPKEQVRNYNRQGMKKLCELFKDLSS